MFRIFEAAQLYRQLVKVLDYNKIDRTAWQQTQKVVTAIATLSRNPDDLDEQYALWSQVFSQASLRVRAIRKARLQKLGPREAYRNNS